MLNFFLLWTEKITSFGIKITLFRLKIVSGQSKDKTWLIAEKEKFDHELDSDADGRMSAREIISWVLPSTE